MTHLTGYLVVRRLGLRQSQTRRREALADADHLRKRHAREIGQLRDRELAEVARDWLPVLDNLERALEHAETDPGAIIEGVRAVRNQAVDLLSRLGYPPRDRGRGAPPGLRRRRPPAAPGAGGRGQGRMMAQARDFYQVLGVSRTASQEEIQR